MAARIEIRLNLKGVNEVMISDGVQADVLRRARAIAAAAGEGFEAEEGKRHPWVARAYVVPTTYQAMAAEARTRALTRAVDAGRG